MTVHDDSYWHSVAAAFGAGQMSVSGDARGRAAQPMSDGWAKYRRFDPNAEPVWIDDAEGNPHWMTQTAGRIASALMALPDGTATTWVRLSAELGVAASTVSRVATKLMAWGRIAYVTGRGRYGGSLVMKRTIGDGLERFRKVAKARIRAWTIAASKRWNERVSRSGFNRATYETWRKGSSTTITNTVGCTIEWTVDDLRKAGIL
jgi:hypothetical protein